MKKEAFAPTWFHIWFLASCLLLFIGGRIDAANGGGKEGFDPQGAAIGMFVMYCLVMGVWRFRSLITRVARLPVPLIVLSVLGGWLFAEIDELVNFPFNPLFPGISLSRDLLLTTPTYLGAHLMWFWVLRRYRFTVFQALITGGLSLGFYELIFGTPSPLVILILPFLIMIHGVHMVVPRIMLSEQLESVCLKESKIKYLLGILLPAVGTGTGILIALMLPA